jgi:energy-coupling factor transporter transmembrane protein EcfT
VASSRLPVILLLLLTLSILVLLSKISWKRLLVTWASGLFFAALVAVPAFFTSGPRIAGLLISRSEASLTCWLLVVMTTPFNRVLRALRALHVPVVFVAILAMTFRYIFLLVESAQDMLLSRRSRLVARMSGAGNRRLLTSTTGVLLGKSIQMSDDVYHAMASRGFRGEIYLLEDFHIKPSDWIVLAAITTVALLIIAVSR